ncbi:hypothetical protein NS277_01300 [Novosphingobium barchaimii]|nr:hypothetical protein NS277_01300 [Novosphingobium barchaimii]
MLCRHPVDRGEILRGRFESDRGHFVSLDLFHADQRAPVIRLLLHGRGNGHGSEKPGGEPAQHDAADKLADHRLAFVFHDAFS